MICGRRSGPITCRRIGLCRLLILIIAAWQAGLFLEALQTRHLQSNAAATQRERGLNNVSAAVWPIVARLDAAGPGVAWTSSFPYPAPAVDWWRLLRTHVGPAFIYSAYYDPRGPGPPKLRIIAALPSRYRLRPLYCDLKYESGIRLRVPGKHRAIRENWGLPYTASFIICDLNSRARNTDTEKDDLPIYVSLGDPKRNITSRPLTVHYPPPKQQNSTMPGFLTVCVKPLHFGYDRALWLIEFIEMYKLLGANHFVFYNKSIGNNVAKVLNYYAKQENVVSLLPWNLPLRSQRHIRTEGLFAALNDCSYRVMHRYQYAALVDLDEFLLPRKHMNLTKLMMEIDRPPKQTQSKFRSKSDSLFRRAPIIVSRSNHGAFLFRNAFFYLYWENDTYISSNQEAPYLLTLAKTKRLMKIHKSGVRSKYIVRPTDVVELGNHVVWEFAPGRSAYTVPETLALSHHYRICEFGGFECTRQASVIDRTAHRFAPNLLNNVGHACNKIFPELNGHCPPALPLGSPW